MTDYKNLVTRLRETTSRSKRKLLDEAVVTIEAMDADLHVYGGCNACKWDRFGCTHPAGEFKDMSFLDAVPGFNCPNWEWRDEA